MVKITGLPYGVLTTTCLQRLYSRRLIGGLKVDAWVSNSHKYKFRIYYFASGARLYDSAAALKDLVADFKPVGSTQHSLSLWRNSTVILIS